MTDWVYALFEDLAHAALWRECAKEKILNLMNFHAIAEILNVTGETIYTLTHYIYKVIPVVK